MKNLGQITATLNLVKQHKQTADTAANQLDAALNKLQDATRTPAWIEAETLKARNQYVPVIANAFNEVGKISIELLDSKPAWDSIEFVLSTRPITKPSGLFQPAQDAALEAAVRLQTMAEFSKMPLNLLRLHATAALASNQLGLFYLANLENNTKSAEPGYQAYDLASIELPDRTQALANISEAKAIHGQLEIMWRTASGRQVSAVDRLGIAYGGR